MLISSVTDCLIRDGASAREYFPIFKKAGVDAVDFSFSALCTYSDISHKKLTNDVFDLPHDEMISFFKEIRDAANENGVVFGQTHAPYPTQIVMDGYEELNAYVLNIIHKCIEVTALFGCKYIVIHPVFPKYDDTKSREEEFEDNVNFYSSLIPTLKKFGVVACLENMYGDFKGKRYGLVCSDFHEANRYIGTLNSIAKEELFGFCFDSGHATICSQDLGRSVEILGKNIKVLHLHDVDGANDNHTLAFFGIADWERLFLALKKIGYDGNLNFEVYKVWRNFPKEIIPQAINLLGATGKYFKDKYF